VLGSIGTSIETALGALDNMAMTFSNIANIMDQRFAFVTIPQYGLYVAKSMPFTTAVCTYLLPIVSFDQRMQWEDYAARNNTNLESWAQETLNIPDHWTGECLKRNKLQISALNFLDRSSNQDFMALCLRTIPSSHMTLVSLIAFKTLLGI
jgi:hypothetical protein